jgi:hypothetical protein
MLRDEANSGTVDLAETARITGRLEHRADGVRELKRRAYSIRPTADGVVPLDLTCPSSREALLGPTVAAYTRSGVLVATDGSLRRNGSMEAALVAKDSDGCLPARSVSVFCQPSSIRPERTGNALALEDCPDEKDLNTLSLSSIQLLRSMQRGDFPLSLHRHPARQLLLHVVKLLHRHGEREHTTRFITCVRIEESRSMNSQTRWLQPPQSQIQHAL